MVFKVHSDVRDLEISPLKEEIIVLEAEKSSKVEKLKVLEEDFKSKYVVDDEKLNLKELKNQITILKDDVDWINVQIKSLNYKVNLKLGNVNKEVVNWI